jgi:bacterial/archaeal transporter family protein
MIEKWFLLSILAQLSFAISTSLDKYFMNKKFDISKTSTLKMFFNSIILLIIGLIFFNLKFTLNSILFSALLGLVFATGVIIYFISLKLRDVEEVAPLIQSGMILLVFIFSIILFNETVNIFNYFGLAFILIGIHTLLSKKGFKLPKLDKSLGFISLFIISGTIYWLLSKKLLLNIEPINLSIMMYFFTAVILFIFEITLKDKILKQTRTKKINVLPIIIASIFGALATFLIYSALTMGNASKVYPMAGLQLVFIFIFASIFLKEKFTWRRLLGTIIITLGIYLTYL